MGQEEGPLTPIEISSLEYELEGETSTGSALSLYILLPPIPPPLSPSPINSPLLSHYKSAQLTCNYQIVAKAVGSNTGTVTGPNCRRSSSITNKLLAGCDT